MKINFRLLYIIGLVFFLYMPVQGDTKKWKLIKQEDDIRVYTYQSPDTFIETVRGEVTIYTSLDNILKVFEDIRNCPNWMYRCKSASTLQQINIVERIDYIVINFPWPTWDRDMVIHSFFQQNRKTKNVVITFQSLPNKVAKKLGYVRVKDMKAIMRFETQKDGGIQFTYEISVDPRGKIPSWMVNAMAVDYPFYTLKNVRRLANK